MSYAWFVYSRQQDSCAQLASPLDSRLDVSHSRNETHALQFTDPDAKRSYYAALESEVGCLVSGR